jgi:hypothetical protein
MSKANHDHHHLKQQQQSNNWKETNLAPFGSNLKKIKAAAANGEP